MHEKSQSAGCAAQQTDCETSRHDKADLINGRLFSFRLLAPAEHGVNVE